MKQVKIKRIIEKAAILSILQLTTLQGLLFFNSEGAFALSNEYNNKIIQSSKSALVWEKKHGSPNIWKFITKVRETGLTEKEKTEAVLKVQEEINSELDDMSAGDLAKDIFVLSACGKDASDFNSQNLLPILLDKVDLETDWSIYTVPYAIMACNSYDFSKEIDSTSIQKLSDMIDYLITTQKPDGQWSSGGADGVGPALYALSLYKDNPKVKATIDKAIEYLRNNQKEDGLFIETWGNKENSNSTAMAILGLSACGVDLEKDFKKDKSTLDMLLNYQINSSGDEDNGAFLWKTRDDGGYDMATEQAVYSLAQAIGGEDYKIFDFKSNWTIESVSVSKLDAKERINVDNNSLAWSAVENASSYVIYVNNERVGKTQELTFQLDNYNKSDKVEVAAIDSKGNLLSKADNFTLSQNNSPINKNGNAEKPSGNMDHNSTDSHNTTYTDSHDTTYSNSPIVTNSPNYTGTVSGNSTVINMGSIYNASGKSKITNNVDVDGKKYSQELESGENADDA